MEERTKMGLVEYIGGKAAPFTVSFSPAQGKATNKMWAAIGNDKSPMIKQRRWLPEPEAIFYNAFADFRLLRWGSSVTTQPVRRPVITRFSDPIPGPQALPLHEILQRQAQAMMSVAPPEAVITKTVTEDSPAYVMSKSGMVHRPDCGSAKRIKKPQTFMTIDDVTADSDFKKFHTCCKGMT